MKSYSLKDSEGDIYWFSKEPIEFLSFFQIKFKDGQISHVMDKLHREDGPAIECQFGTKSWFWHGEFLDNVKSQEEFEIWKRFKNFR